MNSDPEAGGYTRVWQKEGGYIRLPLDVFDRLSSIWETDRTRLWRCEGLWGQSIIVDLTTVSFIEEVTADMVKWEKEEREMKRLKGEDEE